MITDATLQAIAAARKFVDERPSPLPYTERVGAIMGEALAIEATARDLAEALLELTKPNKIDVARVDAGWWMRASGEMVCAGYMVTADHVMACHHRYDEHPVVPGFEWLRRLCDGRLVKL